MQFEYLTLTKASRMPMVFEFEVSNVIATDILPVLSVADPRLEPNESSAQTNWLPALAIADGIVACKVFRVAWGAKTTARSRRAEISFGGILTDIRMLTPQLHIDLPFRNLLYLLTGPHPCIPPLHLLSSMKISTAHTTAELGNSPCPHR